MSELATLYRSLLLDIEHGGSASGMNAVAFSGGLDSSLVAKAVFDVFAARSSAIMALSPSVGRGMREQAERIAAHIGIPLRFVFTDEFQNPEYIANEGMSCYVCKNSIYHAMKAVMDDVEGNDIRVFNGSNKDDLADPTRVGLRAAREHQVLSPLSRFDKERIRELARFVGLPNWDAAASPCLRSRLHIGVPATEQHVHRIEVAEELLRSLFRLDARCNIRVRHMPDDSAMVEIDEARLAELDLALCRPPLLALGFAAVAKRAFRSGSVSAATRNSDV